MDKNLFTWLFLQIYLHPISSEEIAEAIIHTKDNQTLTIRSEECGDGGFLNDLPVSCMCIKGLWTVHNQECSQATFILGSSTGHCFNVNFNVSKVTILSPPEHNADVSSAVATNRDVSRFGGKFYSPSVKSRLPNYVPSGYPVVITTGGKPWRIPDSNLCLAPKHSKTSTNQFCFFHHNVEEEYRLIDTECLATDTIVSPAVCEPYMDDRIESSCNKVHPRFRRSLHTLALRMNYTMEMPENVTEIDENHGIDTKIDRPVINSEIWSFMTYRAQIRLGLREVAHTKNDGILKFSPAFEFLQIAKRIQQKACPDHYVGDDHYDISVGAFESMQKTFLKFTDPWLDLATSERITDALTLCLSNITEYPFLQRAGKKPVSCNGKPAITHGTYEMYEQMMELTLNNEQGSRANEPIVETAWKIFVHAHSACYSYFEKSFNDHHRFATVMLPLFTNEVNDLWFSVKELKPDIYSGFLGDAVDLMDSVAYCAMFSRLESAYPWDIPRPKRDNARKKRSVQTEDQLAVKCIDSSDARGFCPIQDPFGKMFDDEPDVFAM